MKIGQLLRELENEMHRQMSKIDVGELQKRSKQGISNILHRRLYAKHKTLEGSIIWEVLIKEKVQEIYESKKKK